MAKGCTHIADIHSVTPSALGCEECLKSGSEWLHLRICAPAVTSAAVTTLRTNTRPNIFTPPSIRSSRAMIRRRGGWCYVDEVLFDLSDRITPHNGPIP